jgi:hypothetical protein
MLIRATLSAASTSRSAEADSEVADPRFQMAFMNARVERAARDPHCFMLEIESVVCNVRHVVVGDLDCVRNSLCLLLLFAACATSLDTKVKTTKLHGYVTTVISPTQFEIEDYRISRDAAFTLDLENASADLKFKPEDIRVGVELEGRGLLDEDTGEIKATSIKIDMEQFRNQKQTAVLSQPPGGVEHSDAGWSGTFLVDGQRLLVTPATTIVYQRTKRERDLTKKRGKTASEEEDAYRPLKSLDEVTTGMLMRFEGARSIDNGSILATRVEFMHNDVEDGEAKLWKSLKVEIKAFDSAQLKPGDLKISNVGRFKTLPDSAVQKYVRTWVAASFRITKQHCLQPTRDVFHSSSSSSKQNSRDALCGRPRFR